MITVLALPFNKVNNMLDATEKVSTELCSNPAR